MMFGIRWVGSFRSSIAAGRLHKESLVSHSTISMNLGKSTMAERRKVTFR